MRFTVRRPASAEVSPCCHRPSGGDVARGVHVGITRPCTASDALENRLALTVFSRDMPAIGTPLRRVRCRDEFDPPLGLMLQSGNQQPPALAADLSVESPFLRDVGTRRFTSTARRSGHRTHIQVLNADGVEAARHVGGQLFHPVTPAIGFSCPQPRDGPLRSRPPVRSMPCPGQMPLQSTEALGFPNAKARNAQQFSVGQRNRYRDPAIDAHDAAVTGPNKGVGDNSESDVPAPRSIQRDPVRLHGVGDGAGPPETHPTDLRYPYLPVMAAQSLEVVRFEADLPEAFMLAGLTPCRAPVGAVEKVTHRLGEVSQGLLLDGVRSGRQPLVFRAGRRQLGTLLVVTRRVAARLPVLLLLDGKIPDEPGMPAVVGQRGCLLMAGKQPKPAHINNLGRTTDNMPDVGKRRFLRRPKPRISTPQI